MSTPSSTSTTGERVAIGGRPHRGPDDPDDAAVHPHGQNAKEFACTVQAGMPPMFVLQAATTHAAELLHKQDQFGQIAVGRGANVIAVPGNPLDDITVMQHVSFVMKDGVVYKENGEATLSRAASSNVGAHPVRDALALNHPTPRASRTGCAPTTACQAR